MIIRRKAGLMEFSDTFVKLPEVQDMMDRIETVVDPDVDALGRDKLVFKIRLTLRDGKTLEHVSDSVYRGGPKNPLSEKALRNKFLDASQRILDAKKADALIDTILSLDKPDSIRKLVNLAGTAQGEDT